MKLIIAGSRTLTVHDEFINEVLHIAYKKFKAYPTEIVSGKADGIDSSGESFALWAHLPVKDFPYIKELGKGGGHARNKQMAEYADCLLLIWDGKSGGSKNMLEQMNKLNKPVYQVILKGVSNE